jgi:hypothetical protein
VASWKDAEGAIRKAEEALMRQKGCIVFVLLFEPLIELSRKTDALNHLELAAVRQINKSV